MEEPQQIVKIDEVILQLMEQYQPMTFRDIMIRLPDSIDANSVWGALKSLQEKTIIESIRVSNRKSAWKIQLHIQRDMI
jgi:Fe2+ or Zn2+ uptake regulation protein